MTTEVYRNEAGCICQSDAESCFYLEAGGRTVRLSVCALMHLRRRVAAIDLVAMLTEPDRADVEIILTCCQQHLLVLTVREIIALKELLQGTFVMLELNSILRRKRLLIA